jgi:hypothetical protein
LRIATAVDTASSHRGSTVSQTGSAAGIACHRIVSAVGRRTSAVDSTCIACAAIIVATATTANHIVIWITVIVGITPTVVAIVVWPTPAIIAIIAVRIIPRIIPGVIAAVPIAVIPGIVPSIGAIVPR